MLGKKIRFLIYKIIYINIFSNSGCISKNVDFSFSKKANVRIDNKIVIDKYSSIYVRDKSSLCIGYNVFINQNCHITCRKKIVIGDNCMFGPNVCIFDHDHDFRHENRKNNYICDDIIIGNNVWVGSNVTILKGTHIGDNAVIGANSVVKGEIPPNSIYISNTNKIIRNLDKNE